jgi:hypothetical protein
VLVREGGAVILGRRSDHPHPRSLAAGGLAEWLLEQIDADERDARLEHDPARFGYESGAGTCADHVGFMDLSCARVLAECDAKRRIMALDICLACDVEMQDCDHRRETLRLLALPYADRLGYREEWRP